MSIHRLALAALVSVAPLLGNSVAASAQGLRMSTAPVGGFVGMIPSGLGGLVNPGPTIDLDLMAQSIVADLEGNVVGYGYAISQNGQLQHQGGDGAARLPEDGDLGFGEFTRQNVMSVTKTVTAVAVLQLLEQLGLSIASPVAPWLPADWDRGYGFDDATSLNFRELLSHKSGVKQAFAVLKGQGLQDPWGNDFDGLQFVVANGVDPAEIGQYGYKNANYALMRVIIPALWQAAGNDDVVIDAEQHALWYLTYLREHIFSPIGVADVTCQALDDQYDEAYAYDVTGTRAGGKRVSNDDNANCGGHAGLHFSAVELANFMANIRCDYNVKKRTPLLSRSVCQTMDRNRLGWHRSSNGRSNLGKYWHDGAYFDRKTLPRRALYTCIMKYPYNIEATLLVNSEIQGSGVCKVLKNAYDNAKT